MANELIAAPKNEIVVYQPDAATRLEVRVENHMAWLNRQQMATLFGRDVKTIGKHIANALKEELNPTVANFAPVQPCAVVAKMRQLNCHEIQLSQNLLQLPRMARSIRLSIIILRWSCPSDSASNPLKGWFLDAGRMKSSINMRCVVWLCEILKFRNLRGKWIAGLQNTIMI